MILTGHQPNYLPYPGYFEKILQADLFLVVDTVQFVKRGPFGWIHRNRIHAPNSQGWSWLTVPVLTHGRYYQSIQETRIDNRLPWRRKHWGTIQERYRRTEGFAEYASLFAEIYHRNWDSLSELNQTLIREILAILDIRTPVRRLSELSARGQSSELIINFCRELGAHVYLSGIHGRDYLNQQAFEQAGIQLAFQEFHCPEYRQPGNGPFLPNLSIIDMLMCCGRQTRDFLKAPVLEHA